MFKFSKVRLGLIVTCCMVVGSTSIALAGPSVTDSKDNITVTKQAQWTTVDGKQSDDQGNPYAKIDFKIDTTNATDSVINVSTKAGDADVVIVLDNSGSMGAEFDAAKDAAADFAGKMIDIQAFNVRVGLVTMGSTGVRAVEFTSDKNKITSAIKNLQFDPVMWGTNFQDALYETQNLLSTSKAPNKMIIFQSDGVPEQCYKTNNCMTKTGSNIAFGANDSECAIKQTEILKRLYPDVKLATIGYTHATSNHTVLKQMASKDKNGNMMFFESTARANATAYLGNLAQAFANAGATFNNIITGNTLVDKVPSEYEIVASSLKTNDSNVIGKVDNTKNVVTFTWNKKLEKKVYEASFIIKLKKDKVPQNYITEKKEVYTNGTTIDVTKDSTDSAVFSYGSKGTIGLKSPTLPLSEELFKITASKSGEQNLTGQQQDNGQTIQKGLDASPKTADSYGLFVIIGLALASATVCGVIIRKRIRV